MNVEYLLISLLCFFVFTLFLSNIFWFYHYHKLLNKFMSRNYVEYMQAEGLFKQESNKSDVSQKESVDPYEKQRVDDLNQMMGMV